MNSTKVLIHEKELIDKKNNIIENLTNIDELESDISDEDLDEISNQKSVKNNDDIYKEKTDKEKEIQTL